MNRRGNAARIREIALAAGFDRAGIATVSAAATGRAYVRWIADGGHATMSYLERGAERRLDPRSVLPAARSILCVAWQYAPAAGEPAPGGDFWPGVARYARGRDYHDLLRQKLGKVKVAVEAEFAGVEARVCVDTAPLLEREWAARAGLGAFGKNTNLLHPEGGSFFLLAELLLSLELAADLPVADLCGSCTRCLDACPTAALSPYRLESSRCISYWTIEHRGAIPADLRPAFGEWVFGCDICQEVCPWNADPLGDLQTELATPENLLDLDLSAVLRASDSELRAGLRESPLLRPRAEGLKRNAAIAMGNRRDPRYLEVLIAALAGGSPLVRSHCAWALGRIGTPQAVAALREALRTEADTAVRSELQAAIEDPL